VNDAHAFLMRIEEVASLIRSQAARSTDRVRPEQARVLQGIRDRLEALEAELDVLLHARPEVRR
jgi:hypothetical protein